MRNKLLCLLLSGILSCQLVWYVSASEINCEGSLLELISLEEKKQNDSVSSISELNEEFVIEINGKAYTKEQFSDRVIECTHTKYTIDCMNGANGEKIYFEYNDKNRISKKTDNYEVEYTLNDSGLVEEEIVNGEKIVKYKYDIWGTPYCIEHGDDICFFVIENGIIIGLKDDKDEIICKYSYDNFGKICDIIEYKSDKCDIVKINHLLYKGYYYDEETGQYFLKDGGYYNPNNGKVSGLETSLDINTLFGDMYSELFEMNGNEVKRRSSIEPSIPELLASAALYYNAYIDFYKDQYNDVEWYTEFQDKEYHLFARTIMGENDKIAENNNLVLNNFLKYNRQAIGWVIINRYYEEKHRRSLGVGRQFIDSNSTLSYYSVITKGDGDAFHALNGNISKGVMESNNEAYQQAFWMASYARVCNTLTQINSVAPRPTGVTWQCYNKGRLHIDTSPGYNWQRVIFPGSSVDYSGASNYSGFEYYSCIDKFNLVFCYKPGNQGGEDLFIGEIYRLELGIE